MSNRKSFIGMIKELLNTKNLSSSNNQKTIQPLAVDTRSKKSEWKIFFKRAKEFYDQKKLKEARKEIRLALKKFPKKNKLLRIATDIYRASGDRERSLKFAKLLITHNPENWNGYERATQDLLRLKRFKEAQVQIEKGLEKSPNQINLLMIATKAYRATDDQEKSLKYSKLLIKNHPYAWHGYKYAAQGLVALKRFKEAQALIETGLKKNPNQIDLNKFLAYTTAFNGTKKACISKPEKDSISLDIDNLISYSSVPNFFKIIQSKRGAIPEKQKTKKKYIFVAGLGRSGTTALGEMLNISSKIAMYTELSNPFRIDGYFEDDLSKKLVTRTLKIHPHKKTNSIILKKSLGAEWVGDKRPYFQFCAESSFDNLGIKNTKCIFLDRSIIDICRSAHKRAENPNDPSWSLEKGVEHTILTYNASCRQIIHIYKNRPDIFSSFIFPTYEEVFSSAEKAVKLFEFCGVELSESETMLIDRFIKDSQEYTIKTTNPNNPLEVHIRESISLLLDHEVHEHFCNITGNRRNYRN